MIAGYVIYHWIKRNLKFKINKLRWLKADEKNFFQK